MRGSRGGALFALGTGLVALALLTAGGGASAAPGGGHFNLATGDDDRAGRHDATSLRRRVTAHGCSSVGQQGRIRLFKNGALLRDSVPRHRPHRRLLRRARAALDGLRARLRGARVSSPSTTRRSRCRVRSRSTSSGARMQTRHRRPDSRRNVMMIPHQPCSNHNGGQLQFGPDGYLLHGTGTGRRWRS